MDYNNWLNELEKQLIDDKKIVIPMASNNKAKDLYERLTKKFSNKKIILIHKETSEEEKLKKLLNVNNIWIKYDVVIYTPTVCMGVFDPEHFDNIFVWMSQFTWSTNFVKCYIVLEILEKITFILVLIILNIMIQ